MRPYIGQFNRCLLVSRFKESKKLFNLSLSLGILLSIIQQFFLTYDVLYQTCRALLYTLFAVLSLSALKGLMWYRSRFVRCYLAAYYLIFTTMLFFSLLSCKVYLHDIIELFIPLCLLACAMHAGFSESNLRRLLRFYVLIAVLLALFVVFYHGEGIKITKHYFFSEKNQLGPMLGVSSVIVLYGIIIKPIYGFQANSVSTLLFIAVLIGAIAILRNRSGFLALTIVAGLMLLQRALSNLTLLKVLISSIFIVLVVIIALSNVAQLVVTNIVSSVFLLNYDINDMNSISAGRLSVYMGTLDFVSSAPILGSVLTKSPIVQTPHNYVLCKWHDFGVVGSIPLILLYSYLWLFTGRALYRSTKDGESGNTIGFWLLLFSLIVSVFEYTYPYGPGTSQLMVWLLLGENLRNHKDTRLSYNAQYKH